MDQGSIVIISTLAPLIVFLLLLLFAYRLFKNGNERNGYTLLDPDINSSYVVPTEFLNDEEALLSLEDEFDFTELAPEEQSAYLKGQEFTRNHPPDFNQTRGKSYSVEDEMAVKEHGITAFEFEQDGDPLHSRYLVADRVEIDFNNNEEPYSTATSTLNLALPVKKRANCDTVYFETKVYEIPRDNVNGHFSIGLVTKPYPSHFRLPGYNNFSIAYESTGNLKINKPFPTPSQQHRGENSQYNAFVLPPLSQSDVIGFGYTIPSGTIFITRNGRKLMDVMKSCYLDLYPAVGCFSMNAKFSANIGQLGFVWVEANVRRYGFIPTGEYRKIKGERGLATLPEYSNVLKNDSDQVLEKGEELPPRYPEEELDFFGRSAIVGGSSKLEARKVDHYNKESKELSSSTQVTDESEEIMDLRERLYEQTVTTNISSDSVPRRKSQMPESDNTKALNEGKQNGQPTEVQSTDDNTEGDSRTSPSNDEAPPVSSNDTHTSNTQKNKTKAGSKNKSKKSGKRSGKKSKKKSK